MHKNVNDKLFLSNGMMGDFYLAVSFSLSQIFCSECALLLQAQQSVINITEMDVLRPTPSTCQDGWRSQSHPREETGSFSPEGVVDGYPALKEFSPSDWEMLPLEHVKCQITSSGISWWPSVLPAGRGLWVSPPALLSKPHPGGLGRHKDGVLHQGGIQMLAYLRPSNSIRNA